MKQRRFLQGVEIPLQIIIGIFVVLIFADIVMSIFK